MREIKLRIVRTIYATVKDQQALQDTDGWPERIQKSGSENEGIKKVVLRPFHLLLVAFAELRKQDKWLHKRKQFSRKQEQFSRKRNKLLRKKDKFQRKQSKLLRKQEKVSRKQNKSLHKQEKLLLK